ncbi:MAG: adenylosuccinate lyase, partial [Bacteroidetes bacterium]|nr:adenylosuccinate lyase [Bacteroidota bacterium]
QLMEATELLEQDLHALTDAVREKALEHKDTVCIGRTHGVHAEPTTFGLKLAQAYAEFARNRERMVHAREEVATCAISGAVGTFAHLDPDVEEAVLAKLGLQPEPASNQVVQRDRHANWLQVVATLGATIEQMAVEIRNLQRTDVHEVEESFGKGQKGSSAMPHKKNPIVSEKLTGMARLLRGYAHTALENVALWHERDITHSSVERVVIPDSNILLDYMLSLTIDVVDRLIVYPDNMIRNLERTRGLTSSQSVLLALTTKGMKREEAYRVVQSAAMEAWDSGKNFKDLLLQSEQVSSYLKQEEIEDLFDLRKSIKHVDHIFQRVGLA